MSGLGQATFDEFAKVFFPDRSVSVAVGRGPAFPFAPQRADEGRASRLKVAVERPLIVGGLSDRVTGATIDKHDGVVNADLGRQLGSSGDHPVILCIGADIAAGADG